MIELSELMAKSYHAFFYLFFIRQRRALQPARDCEGSHEGIVTVDPVEVTNCYTWEVNLQINHQESRKF